MKILVICILMLSISLAMAQSPQLADTTQYKTITVIPIKYIDMVSLSYLLNALGYQCIIVYHSNPMQSQNNQRTYR
jgi:hypothetical protein